MPWPTRAAAEAALRRGDARPLLGIPVAHKDIYCTRGIRTTGGSALLADWVPDDDATCVQRWQEAGTVLLGKLITHEFAFGLQLPGHRFQPARNPWNLEHIPGGSSSGSGAALAAGLVRRRHGLGHRWLDPWAGGLLRHRRAQADLRARQSRWRPDALVDARSHRPDGAHGRGLRVSPAGLAGHDPADPASSRAPVDDYLGAARPGHPRREASACRATTSLTDIDPEVAQAFEAALATLRGLGAEVRDVTIPSIHATPAFMLIMLAEAFAYHERDIREHPELYGEVLRERILAGALVTAAEYTQAQRLRAQLCSEMAEVLQDVDVLATPTTPAPATPFTRAQDPEFGFPRSNMPPFNLTGLPTLALPCGFASSGLPLSLQLAGRPFEEGTVLRVGHAYEQATPWHTRRPPV